MGTHERYSIAVYSGLTRKYQTRLKKFARDKYSRIIFLSSSEKEVYDSE
jgi:hypothetical protein